MEVGGITLSYLVIGQNAWGHAESLAAAKRNFKRNGGNLSRRYTIAEFAAPLDFQGVDELGRAHWVGEGEPAVSEINVVRQ